MDLKKGSETRGTTDRLPKPPSPVDTDNQLYLLLGFEATLNGAGGMSSIGGGGVCVSLLL